MEGKIAAQRPRLAAKTGMDTLSFVGILWVYCGHSMLLDCRCSRRESGEACWKIELNVLRRKETHLGVAWMSFIWTSKNITLKLDMTNTLLAKNSGLSSHYTFKWDAKLSSICRSSPGSSFFVSLSFNIQCNLTDESWTWSC